MNELASTGETGAASFAAWTANRPLATIGTNAGAEILAFQGWRHFKEAFAPEVVARAVQESNVQVQQVLDPFGGSGTTALASQFLGLRPTTTEVNPYLADLIEAKLSHYKLDSVRAARQHVLLVPEAEEVDLDEAFLPPTFVEPGVGERWIFSKEVATACLRLRGRIDLLADENARRLLRVLLGGVLLEISNARVSGKGRRYRGGWASRQSTAADLLQAFDTRMQLAVQDLERFGERLERDYTVLRGDSREVAYEPESFQLSVFSPPYPNSFDYTDVYNIELWMLGYLETRTDNLELRRATLASHVQAARDFDPAPHGSEMMTTTINELADKRDVLWDRRLPEMVGGYFADLVRVLGRVREALVPGGEVWLVVGDSRYAGVDIKVAEILEQLTPTLELEHVVSEPCRSMRASPQQGGAEILPETLLRLRRP